MLNVIHWLILGQLMGMAHNTAHETGKKLTVKFKLELEGLNSTKHTNKFLQKT